MLNTVQRFMLPTYACREDRTKKMKNCKTAFVVVGRNRDWVC